MLLFKLLPEDQLFVDPPADDTPAPGGDDKPAGGGADPTPPVADPKDVKTEGDPDPAKPEGDGKPAEGEPDEAEKTISELADARAAKLVEERLEAARVDREAEDARTAAIARAEETGRQITAAKGKASTDIVTALKGFRVLSADGKSALELTPEQMDAQVFGPMNEMLDAIEGSYKAEATDEFVDAVLNLVPEEGKEAFIKATADKDLDAGAWLMAAAEALAPKTKWASKRALEVADAVATAKAEGFDAGKAARTVAQPGMQDGNKRTPLTREAFLAMNVEQQAKAYAERPDEVNALT